MAERHGIKTAYQLQTLLNIQPSVAAKWFKNDMKMIGFESLNMLCKYFNCEIADILIYTPDKDARRCFRETEASAEAKVKLDKTREMRARVKEFIAAQLDETKESDTKTKKKVEGATKVSNAETSNIETKGVIIENENSFDTPTRNPQMDNILLSHSMMDNGEGKDTKFNDTESENTESENTESKNTELKITQSSNASDNEPQKEGGREKAAKTNPPALPNGDQWITTEEIAERLGLSKKSVTDYINKKILPSWQAADRTPHFVKESDYPVFEIYYRNLTGKSKP
jgi:DNA-binding Xre family transcriptional regulator/DNA-binding XRE family transcriptional regulator